MQMRAVIASTLVLVAASACGEPEVVACTPEGEIYTFRLETAACCDNLEARDAWLEPSDTQKASSLPEGCGRNSEPFGTLVCLPCGDGVCDDAIEHHCNCPEDCEPA